MKPIHLAIILLCATITLSAQTTADQRAGDCINNREWFKLREIYQTEGDSLSPLLQTFARSMIYHNFNRPDSASDAIAALINHYSTEIGNDNVLNMSYLLSANEYKARRFSNAAYVLQSLIEALEPITDSLSLNPFRSFAQQNSELAKFENVNTITLPEGGDAIIPFRLDSVGRTNSVATTIVMPAIVNGAAQDIVFDSGAGVNVVSNECAQRLGLTLLDASTSATGIGGVQTGKYALAEEIKLGNTTLHNIPFYVFTISSGIDSVDVYLEHLDMILGIELMNMAQEMQIDFTTREITIPHTLSSLQEGEQPNLRGGTAETFVVRAQGNGEELELTLDTGAGHSVLTNKYFTAHKDSIEVNCQSEILRQAGSGGVKIEKSYLLPRFTLSVNGSEHTFKQINVETTEGIINWEDGNLGMDFFSSFDKVIFNTREMFLRLIK